jgi:peptidoglycan hydrolase CwlO-like protein
MQGRERIWIMLAVCVVSALVGAGTALVLVKKEGPPGTQGPKGDRGPRGPEGYAASDEEGEQARSEVQDLENAVQDGEYRAEELESQIAELGYQVTENTQDVSGLCRTVELSGC